MAEAATGTKKLGRYQLHREVARGGMATVYLGRQVAAVGFARTVAIKRLHPEYARDPQFVAMFLDEARLAARIQHPNVVSTLDVVATSGELFLVMEYVQGLSLAKLAREGHPPPDVAVAIVSGMLHGLHAAHEATNERGEAMNIVHRDVSPHNVLVGKDGVARVIDFGIAKAETRLGSTATGEIKGKLAYMAPEQLHSEPVTRRTDVFAAGIVVWEVLMRRRLFLGANEGATVRNVIEGKVPPLVMEGRDVSLLDAVVRKALASSPDDRYATAKEFAVALEKAERPALPSEVSDWLARTVGPSIERMAVEIAEVESGSLPTENLEEAIRKIQSTRSDAPPPLPAPEESATAAVPVVAPDAAIEVPPITATATSRASRTPRWPFAFLPVALLCGFGASRLFGATGGPSTSDPGAPPKATAEASTRTEPSTPLPAAPSAPSVTVTAEPPVAFSAHGPRSKPPVATPPPKAPKVDCSNPIVVNPDGTKTYKRECLK